MKYKDFYIHLFENSDDEALLATQQKRSQYHNSAGEDSRFWGNRGAGVVVYCESTGRFLIGLRSNYVNDSNTWGTFGGKIDVDEDPKDVAQRELEDETGYDGEVELTAIDTFQSGNFKFFNFLGKVPNEYKPRLSWENSDIKWVTLEEFPSNLHFGLKRLVPKLKGAVNDVEIIKEDYPSAWNKDEFEKISSYAGKLKYANSHLKKLASGSGRTVFIIDDVKVLKMAKNKKGVAQNGVEVDWGAQEMYGEIVTKYYDHSDNFYWVEMDRAERISPKKFEQLVGVKFTDFCDYLDSRSNEPYRKKLDPELMARIEEKQFPERVAAFMLDFDKGVGDLKRISSYGIVKREGVDVVVIVDFGLTKQVFDDFYKVGPKKHNYY